MEEVHHLTSEQTDHYHHANVVVEAQELMLGSMRRKPALTPISAATFLHLHDPTTGHWISDYARGKEFYD
jgi:hypothetical protein